ncbi:unnamed protein product [Dovyalis caffra]|uniref:Uncharacterized protein n=1 Tax=Dovyalis caffra TaxID=77055 RepID=A0AAV1S9J8_9ROSI|nr:unnamed protein product [Dovyalis caffra]
MLVYDLGGAIRWSLQGCLTIFASMRFSHKIVEEANGGQNQADGDNEKRERFSDWGWEIIGAGVVLLTDHQHVQWASALHKIKKVVALSSSASTHA